MALVLGAVALASLSLPLTTPLSVRGASGTSPQTLSSVAFGDATDGWAVGGTFSSLTGNTPAIIATTDGGATWTLQTVPAGIGEVDTVTAVDATHAWITAVDVGSSRVDLQACKLEYSIVSPK